MNLRWFLLLALALSSCSWSRPPPGPMLEDAPDNALEVVINEDDILYQDLDGSLEGGYAGTAGRTMDAEKEQLEIALAPQMSRNEVVMLQLSEGIFQITTDRALAFAPGSSEVDPGLFPILREIARTAASDGMSVITVYGHADAVLHPDKRKELAGRRAEAVRAELVRLGVSPFQITAAGAPQEDFDGRIEIIIQPLIPRE